MAEGTCSEKDLKRALEAYGLEADSFRLLRKGYYCEVYLSTISNETYVVRVRPYEAQAEDVVFTGIWTRAISAEVPVPVSLMPTGEVPQVNGRFVEVAPYVEHDNIEGKFIGPEGWTTVGEWVGRMHRLGQTVADQAPVDLDYGNHPNDALFNRYLEQTRIGAERGHLDVMHRVDRLVEQFDLATAGLTFPTGVVHGDMHFWNVLYAEGNPVAFIDFDFLQRGILLYDLAYAHIWLTTWEEERGWQKEGGEEWIGITEHYLSAYETGRQTPLSAAEKTCLPWMRVRIHLLFFLDNVRASWNRLGKAMEDLEQAECVADTLRCD